ncbi:Lipase 2 [Novipirellula galeiformis]|uniref:Lipase 2 n=1 Tax=Novipirellula galeiformis TaxID=2528004 RepID=A0A5C6C0V7_9BACT|nr:alpha/beta hydrolase [Novipirellula galeiformis]TWU17742.1 Lipase 2 [Novipirellula galeiformis]
MTRPLLLLLALLTTWTSTNALAVDNAAKTPKYSTDENILYRTSDDASINKSCRLDVYYPEHISEFPTIVWFHGGGLTAGKRGVPKQLRQQGVAVVAVSYRLSPSVKASDCLDDAAAAVAWTLKHIEQYGGSAEKIFVSGASAGGYITSMIGLDKKWLAGHHVDADTIAGLIPLSGHTITHFTVRKERGIDEKQPIVDDMAPLFHVRGDCPPLLLITGDRELELLGRYEENAYLWRMMKIAGHTQTTLYELDGSNHSQMVEPAMPLLLRFVKQHAQKLPAKK